jgi:cytochrome c553
MSRLASLFVVFLALALPGTLLARGNAEKGKAKAEQKINNQSCAECHGATGDAPKEKDQPILAGQYADYLVKALNDYRSGKRVNAVMNGVAKELSRQDIEDLAAWFSSQKSAKLHFQR